MKMQAKKYGMIPSTPDGRNWVFSAATPEIIPDVIDLRPGFPFPIQDQGVIGSCVGHGTAEAIEYDCKKQGYTIFKDSRLFNYYLGRLLEDNVENDNGCQIRDVLKQISKFGTCTETLWPYVPLNMSKKPTDACWADAKQHQITSYHVVPQNYISICHTLMAGYPIIVGSMVTMSMEQITADGIVPMPPIVGDSVAGGHCFIVCGKTVVNKVPYWIARNSWGTNYGDQGYMYLPIDYLLDQGLTTDLWVINAVEA